MNISKLSIIIVSWNGKKWLKDCFDSIYRQTYKNIEIILVDNGSSDGSVLYVRENYPKIKIIENERNLGFGRANNIGANNAEGEILFLLNNDTIIEDENFLLKILEYKEKNKLNITGPKILNFNKEDIYKGRKLSIDCTGYLGWAKETFYVEGCAMLIDRELYLVLAGFDQASFAYSEDIDLCWRAQLYGMKIGVCDDVAIMHYGGGSSETTQLGRKEKHIVPTFRKYEVEKNNLRNLLKNYNGINLFWTIPLFLLQLIAESMFYAIIGNWKIIRYMIKSVYWNVANIGDTLRERRKIQKQRIIGDNEILSKMSFGLNKPKAFFIIGMPEFK